MILYTRQYTLNDMHGNITSAILQVQYYISEKSYIIMLCEWVCMSGFVWVGLCESVWVRLTSEFASAEMGSSCV